MENSEDFFDFDPSTQTTEQHTTFLVKTQQHTNDPTRNDIFHPTLSDNNETSVTSVSRVSNSSALPSEIIHRTITESAESEHMIQIKMEEQSSSADCEKDSSSEQFIHQKKWAWHQACQVPRATPTSLSTTSSAVTTNNSSDIQSATVQHLIKMEQLNDLDEKDEFVKKWGWHQVPDNVATPTSSAAINIELLNTAEQMIKMELQSAEKDEFEKKWGWPAQVATPTSSSATNHLESSEQLIKMEQADEKDEFEKKWGWPAQVASDSSGVATPTSPHLESSEQLIKMEADEKDELGPILNSGSTFRTRCYTWPRQYLEASSPIPPMEPLIQTLSANCPNSSDSEQQQSSIIEEESCASNCSSTEHDHDLESLTNNGCGSPKQKNSSRRNAWGNQSYADLITQAIKSTPEQRLTLSQIYDWVVKNVPYFKDKGDSASSSGWKNSIRHNLSLHSRFKRVQNEGQGKSSWWMMNHEATRAVATTANLGSNPAKHCSHHHLHHHYRKRSNTLESVSRLSVEKKKGLLNSMKRRDSLGSIRSLTPSTRRDLQRTASSGSLSYPESPEFTMRPRTLSNASSCGGGGGRMSPMPCLPRGSLLPTATAGPASTPTASATAASVASSDLSNASSTATLAEASAVLDRSLDPAISPPQWQQTSQCHSPIPIFNYMNKLRIDEPSTLDDLEDINSLIDTEVGVENLNQNEFENNQLMAQFQQDMAKIKILEPRFKPIQFQEQKHTVEVFEPNCQYKYN